MLTFARQDHPSHFDVMLVRTGLAPPPPHVPVQKPDAAALAAETPSADLSAAAISNTSVMQSLYTAIDAARLDVALKEEEVSVIGRQLQSAQFHSERERAAAAAAEARRMHLVEVIQQLDEEAQVDVQSQNCVELRL